MQIGQFTEKAIGRIGAMVEENPELEVREYEEKVFDLLRMMTTGLESSELMEMAEKCPELFCEPPGDDPIVAETYRNWEFTPRSLMEGAVRAKVMKEARDTRDGIIKEARARAKQVKEKGRFTCHKCGAPLVFKQKNEVEDTYEIDPVTGVPEFDAYVCVDTLDEWMECSEPFCRAVIPGGLEEDLDWDAFRENRETV